MEKNISGLKTKKTLHKLNIKKIKAFGEYISNQMLFIFKRRFHGTFRNYKIHRK